MAKNSGEEEIALWKRRYSDLNKVKDDLAFEKASLLEKLEEMRLDFDSLTVKLYLIAYKFPIESSHILKNLNAPLNNLKEFLQYMKHL